MKTLKRRISRKGQVTIPLEIRRKLGLKAGDKVVFAARGKDVGIRKQSGETAVIGLLDAHAGELAQGISVGEMKKAVKAKAAQKFKKP